MPFLQKVKDLESEAVERKKKAGRVVVSQTLDKARNMLNDWKKSTYEYKQYKKCRLVMKFMESLNRELIVNAL